MNELTDSNQAFLSTKDNSSESYDFETIDLYEEQKMIVHKIDNQIINLKYVVQ